MISRKSISNSRFKFSGKVGRAGRYGTCAAAGPGGAPAILSAQRACGGRISGGCEEAHISRRMVGAGDICRARGASGSSRRNRQGAMTPGGKMDGRRYAMPCTIHHRKLRPPSAGGDGSSKRNAGERYGTNGRSHHDDGPARATYGTDCPLRVCGDETIPGVEKQLRAFGVCRSS